MSFLDTDLPAVIQYKTPDKGELNTVYLITSMGQVQWFRDFNVIKKKIDINDLKSELIDIQPKLDVPKVSVIPLDESHWLKQEVENYVIPATVLNEMGELTTSIDGLADAIKRAMQWSSLYGTLNYVNPTAIVYNVIHQLTGLAVLPELDDNDRLELSLTESIEGIKLNRYLIDYTYPNGDNELQFSCYAPNAELAIVQTRNEIDPDVNIVNVNRLTPVSFEGKESKFTYSIRFRLRHEAIVRYCYYHSDLLSTSDVHSKFTNENVHAIVYEVVRVIENKKY